LASCEDNQLYRESVGCDAMDQSKLVELKKLEAGMKDPLTEVLGGGKACRLLSQAV
jgi:hypothetical protein